MIHPRKFPSLVFADDQGNISDFPDLHMAGASAGHIVRPDLSDIIPLPTGSELFCLDNRLPVGCDPVTAEPLLFTEHPTDSTRKIRAVAAFMAPAHTVTYNAAFQREENAQHLPLFAYAAVGWMDGQFWACGFRSDPDVRQDLNLFSQKTLQKKTKTALLEHTTNRLIQHLGKCCLTYGCPAARNYFLGRYEAPLPTSPVCNARCLGCISLQESGCCRSTQDRITFIPTPQEIAEIAIPHLNTAKIPVVSFGQGCEGEPLLQASTIERAIIQIRRETTRGTINLNSNSSLPDQVELLARAGLDSLRVSLNSVQQTLYTRYYRPKNYSFEDVSESIRKMKQHDKFVSLNYFILPGLTDSLEEYSALCAFIREFKPDLIQLRNLNMDHEWYCEELGVSSDISSLGITNWLKKLRKSFPSLRFGYFNPCLNPE